MVRGRVVRGGVGEVGVFVVRSIHVYSIYDTRTRGVHVPKLYGSLAHTYVLLYLVRYFLI